MQYPSSWLKGSSLGESIAAELRLQIIAGTIKPDAVLSENRIAADFGTSRSPVREALKTLSGEGLIRLQRMGAVVNGLSLQDVDELYDVRYLIESFASQRMADDPEALIAPLSQIIDKMVLAGKHRDVVEFAYQDLCFHETIIAGANHTRIMHLWTSIRQIVMTVMLITTREVLSQGEDKIDYVIGKHRKLLQALESRDADIIGRNVEEYFADSHRTLQTSIPQ
ncbi:GntR family transcriptional regulator [Paenibacillus sp. DXFW5]|jgi:GntR family transcriptional regulator, gluconate operon transcriptional repressor|uniref:GntR family transcriptional regulator n=1 Tax=Paenibacillus rhizolycopersici TaxID=2780073 RepID=A0ABS2H6M5_9BACL|nr:MULTISPECIES: GntR family transcriptional regulator [Paenibacillus]MBM6996451.1 GntR family transcriptional regulator [Paenibacillus rhizolycopersici]GIP47997.1 GntR family transcriptional regulator [Paenibacillus sp. J53TS2]